VAVVQNGEIYNHRELRSELEERGHRFATASDTEVVAHLYEEHGLDFLDRLRGMFALALWDSERRRLVLARDRFGIKPLYVTRSSGRLAWGSELKALLALPWFSREVDLDALQGFLAFNSIPAPLTIFAAAQKLPAGHRLVWDGGEPRVQRWARPAPVQAEAVRRESATPLGDELRERLRDSVRAHLVSDVPVGVLLSGGIDSSGLTALAAMESRETVRTFSIGFEERSFDELGQARQVAERYGTDHHELVLRPHAAELLPRLVGAFDEPFGDSSALPTFLVSELAASEVKVALSGEGGDELFGGYETYVADLLARRVGRAARLAAPLVERLPSSSRRVPLEYRAKRFVRSAHLPPLESHHAWKEIFSPEARAQLLVPERLSGHDPLEIHRRRHAETEGSEDLARLQDVDLGIYLVDDLLVKTDRMSMAHSLEARVPFLDTAVSELALALPTHHKVRGMAKKRLLRRALAPLLPRSIVQGRKRGFSIPAAAWLRGDLEPLARDLLSPATLRRQGFFEPALVTGLLDRHASGREDLSRQLWGLLCFAIWHDQVLAGARGAGGGGAPGPPAVAPSAR
jgi:asparagine synthase (glutamine-hydrolysing)